MKRRVIFSFILLCIVPILTAGCYGTNEDFTIRVSGTDGLEFTGQYGVTEVFGKIPGGTDTEDVEDFVPVEYSVTGEVVWCSFEKTTRDGTLKVEIVRDDGVIIAEQETSEPFGSVSVAASNSDDEFE